LGKRPLHVRYEEEKDEEIKEDARPQPSRSTRASENEHQEPVNERVEPEPVGKRPKLD